MWPRALIKVVPRMIAVGITWAPLTPHGAGAQGPRHARALGTGQVLSERRNPISGLGHKQLRATL